MIVLTAVASENWNSTLLQNCIIYITLFDSIIVMFQRDWQKKPALIMFATDDIITRSTVPDFKRLLPHAKEVGKI